MTIHNRVIRFDRNEFSGAFGDIGTDLPLIVGMILTCGLDSASTLIMFGIMQIMTAILYGIPMPMQPLKAMAVTMLTQKLSGNVLYGAGLSIGIAMFFLTATNLIDLLAKIIPKCVIRGIQFGLGFQLASISLKNYVQSDGLYGYLLAIIGFIITIFLLGNRKYPPALFVIILGIIYAFIFKLHPKTVIESVGFSVPTFNIPNIDDITKGFLILAIPQIPLSLGNSIFATHQIAKDFFPEHSPSIKKIGFTYSIINLINPFFCGIPTCHGAGGMAGHYAFGARTGGSIVIYGIMYLLLGFFFSTGFDKIANVFPQPILGVILLFEGLTLMLLVKDTANSKVEFTIALLVGLISGGLPFGYLIGLIVGTLIFHLSSKNLIGLGK